MIFTTKNKEFAIFGKTITDVKENWKEFKKELAENNGKLFGENGALASLFSGKKQNNILSPETLKQFDEFKEKFNSSSLSAEALAEQMENVDQRIIDYAKTCKNGEMTTEGFKASIDTMSLSVKAGRVALQALAMAGNMLIMWGVTKAIELAVTAFDNWIHRVEKAKEAAIDSAKEYSTLQSEIESLNKELDTTTSRITELEGKEHLTFIEQEELDKLRQANEELERQIENRNILAGIAKEKSRDDAVEYFNEKEGYHRYAGWDTRDVELGNARYGQAVTDVFYGSQIEIAKQQLADYEDLLEQQKRVQNEILEIQNANPSNYESLDEYQNATMHLTAIEDNLKLLKETIGQTITDFDSLDDSLDLDKDVELLTSLEEISAHFQRLFNPDSAKDATTAFNEIWNAKDFSKSKKELMDMAKAGELNPSVLKSNKEYQGLLDATGKTAKEVCENIYALADAEKQVGENSGQDQGIPSFTEAISQIQLLSKGLDQLGKIYSDVLDKEDFDWSSILNNDDFKEAFAETGEAYENFIEMVSNSPNDIEACQSAFDDLATAYINSSGALNGLTEETKAATIEQLKQMGIVNAEEIVTKTLAASTDYLALSKSFLATKGKELTDATWEEISAFIDEANYSNEAKIKLAELALAKQTCNGTTLDFSGDINNLVSYVSILGGVTDALVALNAVRNGQVGVGGKENYEALVRKAQAEVKGALNGADNYNFKANYSGGSVSGKSSGSGGGGSSSSKSTMDFYDWIEVKISRIDKEIDTLQEKATNALGWKAKNALQDTVFDQLQVKLDVLSKSYDRYMAQADSISLSDTLKQKVQIGDIDIESLDDATKELVTDYSNWYNKAQDIQKTSEETRKEMEEIAKTKLDNIAEDFEESTEIIDSNIDNLQDKVSNTIGWRAKNKVQDTIYDQLSLKLSELNAEHDLYLKEMQSLGLSDIYKRKIEGGSLTTEEYNSLDEGVRKVVDTYRDLYSRAQESEESIRKTNEAIRETSEEKLDNIIHDYESIVSLLEKYTNYRKDLLDLRDRWGESADREDYDRLLSDQYEIIEQLTDKYDLLNAEINSSDLEKGSEKWIEMQEELEDTKGSLIDCANSIEDFKDAILELRFKPLEDLVAKLDAANSEFSDMLTLMGDSNLTKGGMLTDKGMAAVALYGQQLLTAKKQAAEYANAIGALEVSYRNNDMTQEEYTEKLYEYQSAQRQAAIATKEARDAILALREDAIQEEIDAYNELIDAKKKALDAEKELDDYRKNVADKSKTIAMLEKQIAALSLSSNRADQAKKLELEEQLAEAREELTDYQADYSRDKQKEALDEQAEAYEKAKQDELDELKTNLDKQDELLKQYLTQVKNNYQTVYSTLTTYADAYGMEVTDALTTPFESAEAATESFSGVFTDMVSEINYQLEAIDWEPLERLKDYADEIANISSILGSGRGNTDDNSWQDITGEGQWQWDNKKKNYWYGSDEDNYAKSGYYNINGKTYGFDSGGWMRSGWDNSSGRWYYFEPENGQMVKSAWRQYKNGDWYYLTSSGEMAHDAAIKSKDGDGYYYVNSEGVWDGQTLTEEEVKKRGYTHAYRGGTWNARKGRALIDEEGPGSEMVLTNGGTLVQFTGGEHVFNSKEADRLHAFASMDLNKIWNLERDFPKMEPSYMNTGVTINSPLLQVDTSGMSAREIATLLDNKIKQVPSMIAKQMRYEAAGRHR